MTLKYDFDGYKRDGIVEAIFWQLCMKLPFREMMESYGVTEDDIKGTINWALYYHCGLK